MSRRRAGGRGPRAVAVPTVVLLLVACGGGSRVGDATSCPDRNAYCPPRGPLVGYPDRPVLSPSGRYRLEVMPGDGAGEDWRFRVVTAADGRVALDPGVGFDGGLGLVVTWGAGQPDTVWVSRWPVRRWTVAANGSWRPERVADGEPVPDVVEAARRSDAT